MTKRCFGKANCSKELYAKCEEKKDCIDDYVEKKYAKYDQKEVRFKK